MIIAILLVVGVKGAWDLDPVGIVLLHYLADSKATKRIFWDTRDGIDIRINRSWKWIMINTMLGYVLYLYVFCYFLF